ncbi:MAG: phosphatase PAP2 family protein [Burkholderiales bacterium]|nr:phosphatase PAP2 family protein [Burkholderiales bacterium]
MIDQKDARFAATSLFFLAVSGILLVWLSRDGTVDFAVSRFFFDPVAGIFPLKDVPLFAVGGHTGLKWLALFIWLSGALAAATSARVILLRRWRSPLVFFCVAVVLTTLVATLLKMASAHSCPWDLKGLGGAADWFPLFDLPVATTGPGHCWPSGHAAGGFSLIAGYFAFRRSHRLLAGIAFVLALGLGALMSFVQIARGAHFLSHNLWSLWIAWFCSLMSFLIWRVQIRRGSEGNRHDVDGF